MTQKYKKMKNDKLAVRFVSDRMINDYLTEVKEKITTVDNAVLEYTDNLLVAVRNEINNGGDPCNTVEFLEMYKSTLYNMVMFGIITNVTYERALVYINTVYRTIKRRV